MTPTTLVTGGAGFIGSHLCDGLAATGEEVPCLDNFYLGTKDNIRHLLSKPNFELIRHDIGPVNLGNPVEFTVRQLAETVLRLTGSKRELVFLPLPQDDPVRRQPDINLARKTLDWQPKVALEDGLKETIAYFRKLLAS